MSVILSFYLILFSQPIDPDNRIDESQITVSILQAVVCPNIGEGHLTVAVEVTTIGYTGLLNKRLLERKTGTATDRILADTEEPVGHVTEVSVVDVMLVQHRIGILMFQHGVCERITELHHPVVLLIEEDDALSTELLRAGAEGIPLRRGYELPDVLGLTQTPQYCRCPGHCPFC